MRIAVLLVFTWFSHQLSCQSYRENLSLQIGPLYNISPGSDEFNSSTALGLFFEANYELKKRVRMGVRWEPSALVWGILELPGGCDGVCREGANFLYNYYLKADYLIGKAENTKVRSYFGVNLLFQSHKRYIITSRVPGNFMDTRRTVANLGYRFRFGIMLGRFDLSTAYQIAGQDFQDYLSLNLGYTLWR